MNWNSKRREIFGEFRRSPVCFVYNFDISFSFVKKKLNNCGESYKVLTRCLIVAAFLFSDNFHFIFQFFVTFLQFHIFPFDISVLSLQNIYLCVEEKQMPVPIKVYSGICSHINTDMLSPEEKKTKVPRNSSVDLHVLQNSPDIRINLLLMGGNTRNNARGK